MKHPALPKLRPRSSVDGHNATAILVIVAALAALGVVLVYSSSSVGVALHKYQDVTRFLRKQLLWVTLGVGAFVLARTTPLDTLRRWSPAALLASVVLLLAVFVPGLRKEAGGASRWITFAGVRGQPSELAKLGLILFVAGWASTQGDRLRTLGGALPGLGAVGLVAGLVVIEPDMGTALLIGAVCTAMLLVAGVRLRHLLLVGSPCFLVGLAFAIAKLDYIWRRVHAFMDPIASASGAGYQTRQAVIALGSGGPFGVGLGASQQKLLFLPDMHTDFIFALVGEELGFVGALAVVGLFAALAVYGMKAVDRARDSFAFLLATGIVLLLGAESILNMAVATNSVPPKGIALPFLSFGGSSMLAAALAAGVLTRIAATGREPEPLLAEVAE